MSLLAVILAAAAVKGGSITMYGASAPKSANAYIDNSHYTSVAFSLAYMTLVETDDESGELAPGLAREWKASEDGREFTFALDPRAKWSDGRKVTAHDVKWTFDAIMDPKNDTGPWKAVLASFESPEVLDGGRVRFAKKGDSPKDWRDLINCATFWVLPAHRFEGRDFNGIDMIGEVSGGPYRFESAIDETETVMRRDEGWWRAKDPDVAEKFNFDRIRFKYFANAENGFTAFRRGKLDFYPVYSARIMALQTLSEEFTRNWILKRRVTNGAPVGFQGYAMNMRRPPFDDVRVRKAMAHLVDRERMNRTLMHGEYFLLRSYWHDLYDAEHPCENEFFDFSPEKAARLLDEAGWLLDEKTGRRMRGGRPLEFTYLSRSPDEDRFLSLFSAALKEVGIAMKIDRKDFASWMRDMDDFNFDMTVAAWGAGLVKYPAIQWSSSEAARKGSNNLTGFADSEVDALIEAERSMETVAERNEAYRKMDAKITASVPYVLLWGTTTCRLLYWNKFGMPATVLPRFSREEGALSCWWADPDREDELSRQKSKGGFLPSVGECVSYFEVVK
ncbi:MAG: ABC transporter substrate-binding protein [Kiritimatiellae bacterium]|nr:ABC transporter substrate-binding protein [Kiritimatiellia bacterium]